MGYFKDTAKGIFWMSGLRASARLGSLLRIAILARILNPEEFGIFGIATLTLALLEIITETGINVFLIQQGGDIRRYLNTAWVVSIFRGLLIALLIFLSAPFISGFFNSPQSLPILVFIGVVPLLRGFINPSIVRFQKELAFHKEFWFRSSLFLFEAAVAIFVSLLTRSAVGLVWGLVASGVLEVLLSFVFIAPRPALAFEAPKVRKVIARGKWLTAAGLFNYLFHQGDDVVVGRLLNINALGIYQVVYRISSLPIYEVGEIFNKVTFPVYRKIRSDKKRLRRAFLKVTFIISSLVIPFGLFLFFFPDIVIKLVLGEQWLGGVAAMKVLAIFGIVRAISGSSSALFLAIDKQEYLTTFTLASIAGLGLTILPLTQRFGIAGAATAALIGSISALPIIIYYLRKTLRNA